MAALSATHGFVTQVVMDQETGKPRGFGFVTFDDVRDAQDAVADARGKVGACLPNRRRPACNFVIYSSQFFCHFSVVAGARWKHTEGQCS